MISLSRASLRRGSEAFCRRSTAFCTRRRPVSRPQEALVVGRPNVLDEEGFNALYAGLAPRMFFAAAL